MTGQRLERLRKFCLYQWEMLESLGSSYDNFQL
jgi:hypothetical protein